MIQHGQIGRQRGRYRREPTRLVGWLFAVVVSMVLWLVILGVCYALHSWLGDARAFLATSPAAHLAVISSPVSPEIFPVAVIGTATASPIPTETAAPWTPSASCGKTLVLSWIGGNRWCCDPATGHCLPDIHQVPAPAKNRRK